MPKRPVLTDAAAPPAGAYSQAMVAGNLVFLAGQGPFRSNGEQVTGAFREQARQAFANLAAVAVAAGSSLAEAVRVGVYLTGMENFAAMNDIYREFFPEPLPARTTIQSDLAGFDIEVDAIS